MNGRSLVEAVRRLMRALISGRTPGSGGRPAAVGMGGKVALLSAALVMAGGFGVGIVGGADLVRADTVAGLDLSTAKDLVPLEEIIAKAKAEHDGRLIEAELKRRDGIEIYETEILDEGGKVWEMYFDAKTGRLIRQLEEGDGGDENPGG